MIERTVRNRSCPTCNALFETPHGGDWPAAFCSSVCHRLSKPVKAHKARSQMRRATEPNNSRKAISPASPAQRTAIKDRACIVCAQGAGYCHPAHLIDKSLAHDDNGDPRAVVPLCPTHHREYDDESLSLLEHLEPHHRSELAYAVERHGLLRTLQRVTNTHWAPVSGLPVEREGRAA